MTKTILVTFASLTMATTAIAQEGEDSFDGPEPLQACEEAITVFQDVSFGGRKDRAAKNITKKHAGMAKDGWRFSDMEIYTENSDLEGFFLSYTRAVACSDKGDD